MAAALVACPSQRPRGRAPNVLLVSVDTLRADVTAPYGGHADTPTLARLAREGVLFERAFAPASTTAPSHVSLLSGLDPLQHGVVRNATQLPDGIELLTERFRAAGYRTGAFVSSFILDPRFGWNRGFETYDASFPRETASVTPGRGAPPRLWSRFAFEGYDRHAGRTTALATRWLEQVQEPCFLFVHYFDPHAPYVPPEEFDARRPGVPDATEGRAARGVSDAELAESIRLYHAEVEFVDAVLADLIAALELFDRPTLVAVTADHGEGLGQRGFLYHSLHIQDELVRVPLVFCWSDRSLGGRRIATPVGLVDVAPTLLELAGLAALPETDGRSLASSIERGSEVTVEPVLGYRRPLASTQEARRSEEFSLRLGRWTLIRSEERGDALFDSDADRGETRDVASHHPGVLARLARQLDERVERRRDAREPAPLPPDVGEALEALGYAE